MIPITFTFAKKGLVDPITQHNFDKKLTANQPLFVSRPIVRG